MGFLLRDLLDAGQPFCHEDDQACKDAVESKSGHLVINQSVCESDIDAGMSAACVKKADPVLLPQGYFCARG